MSYPPRCLQSSTTGEICQRYSEDRHQKERHLLKAGAFLFGVLQHDRCPEEHRIACWVRILNHGFEPIHAFVPNDSLRTTHAQLSCHMTKGNGWSRCSYQQRHQLIAADPCAMVFCPHSGFCPQAVILPHQVDDNPSVLFVICLF